MIFSCTSPLQPAAEALQFMSSSLYYRSTTFSLTGNWVSCVSLQERNTQILRAKVCPGIFSGLSSPFQHPMCVGPDSHVSGFTLCEAPQHSLSPILLHHCSSVLPDAKTIPLPQPLLPDKYYPTPLCSQINTVILWMSVRRRRQKHYWPLLMTATLTWHQEGGCPSGTSLPYSTLN